MEDKYLKEDERLLKGLNNAFEKEEELIGNLIEEYKLISMFCKSNYQ